MPSSFIATPPHYEINDRKLTLTLVFELVDAVTNSTIETVKALTATAVADELSQSPEFAKAIREMAIKKIMKIIEDKANA